MWATEDCASTKRHLFEIQTQMNLENKTAWITGAGSGIGRALAYEIENRGGRCILSDINEITLKETVDGLKAESVLHSATIDVGDRDRLKAFIHDCIANHGPVDLVINNAGTSLGPKTVNELTYDEVQWLFDINLWGVLIGSKEFLPHLLTRPEAYIVNISSVFGIIGYKKQAPYCMTKFAVRGLTETMRVELADTNVRTLSVHPGGIDTNIVRNSKWNDGTEKQVEDLAKEFKKAAKTSPSQAARVILNAVHRNKRRVRIGLDARMMDYMARLSPERAASWIAKIGPAETI